MTRRFLEGIFIGIISGFILKGLDKYWGLQMLKSIYQTFVIEMWPIWIGLIITIIYWFIRFLINFRAKYINYNKFVKTIEDDLRKKQEAILGAWQKISRFENQIEQLTEVTIPSLIKKIYQLKDKSSLLLKLGVYWDDQLNPYCPKCEIPLSGAAYSNILRCPKCKEEFTLRYGSEIYPLEVAVQKIKNKEI